MYHLKEEFSTFSVEQLYYQLIAELQKLQSNDIPSIGEKASYRITKAFKSSGVSFVRASTSTRWEISKEEWLDVLAFVKETGQSGFNTQSLQSKLLVFKRQSPTIAFLLGARIVA